MGSAEIAEWSGLQKSVLSVLHNEFLTLLQAHISVPLHRAQVEQHHQYALAKISPYTDEDPWNQERARSATVTSYYDAKQGQQK